MRRIQGRQGGLFAVSTRYQFRDLPLVDCGSGFDWRVADRSMGYWLSDPPPTFRFRELGVWREIETVEVFPRMGRVGFGRCPGSEVRADGTCLPLTEIASLDGWELHVEMEFRDNNALGDEARQIEAKTTSVVALLKGIRTTPQDAVVRLSPTEEGALVGAGTVTCDGVNTVFLFDDEGVRYESC